MNVRLTCTSKRRVPKNGMLAPSTCPSSMTSPVLISLTALSTACGFMWLAEPRSSPAPHFDGQRAPSGGGVKLGAWARAAVPAMSVAPSTAPNAMRCMVSSRWSCWSGRGPGLIRMPSGAAPFKHRLQLPGPARSAGPGPRGDKVSPRQLLAEHDPFRKPVPTFRDHALEKALRVDVHVELDIARAFGRGGKPFPQIAGEIEGTRRLHQQAEPVAAAHHG